MTLGEYIKLYREEHHMSQRTFIEMCNGAMSTGYISMLEKNYNPATGKQLAPSIEVYKAVADATNVTLDWLLRRLDGASEVTMSDPQYEHLINRILEVAQTLPPDRLELARSLLLTLAESSTDK